MAGAKVWGLVGKELSRPQKQTLIWREMVSAILLLILITSVPYVYGYVSAPSGTWFSGIVFNVHDSAQYLSWMRESADRVWIENKLTSEPNPAVFLNLHWWIAGRVAALFSLSLQQIYALFRVAAIAAYVLVVYWMAKLFYSDEGRQRFVFWLTTLTSGFGWLWIADKYLNGLSDPRWPNDVYITPGNSLWVMIASPHLTLALVLTLLVLGLAWLSVIHQHRGYAWAAAGVALFLGLGHIYDLVTVWAVLGLFGMLLTLREGWQWRTFTNLALVVAVSAPAALYFAWVSSPANPTWQLALRQYDNLGVFTPRSWHLVILLGLTFLLALAQLARLLYPRLRRRDWRLNQATQRELFLGSWFVANLIIIYLPLRFQVMLLTGIQFVMAALAADLIYDFLVPRLAAVAKAAESRPLALVLGRLAAWLPSLILLLVIPTNLYLLSWRVFDLRRTESPYFLKVDDLSAMQWLETHAQEEDVVLSALDTGHFIPGLAGTRAYYANSVMTLDFNRKRSAVYEFFDAETSQAQRCAWLAAERIAYLFFGESERQLGGYDPGSSQFLQPVFISPQTRVFAFDPEGCPGQ